MASGRPTPSKVICNFSACSPNRLHENIVRVAKSALPPPFKNGMYQAPGHEQLRSFEPVARAVQASPQKRPRVQSGQSLLQNDIEELCRPRKKLRPASCHLAPAERTLSPPDIQRTPAHPIASENAAMTTTLKIDPIRWDLTTTYQASESLLSNASRSDSQHILPTKSQLSTTQPLPPIPTIENTLLHPQTLPPTNPTNKPAEEAEEKETPQRPLLPRKKPTNSLPPSQPPSTAIYAHGTTSIPPAILSLATTIKSLPRKNTYPMPTALRGVTGMNQRNGFLLKQSPLMAWYGDTRIFGEKWWKFLFVGGMYRRELVRVMGGSGEEEMMVGGSGGGIEEVLNKEKGGV